jgi:hypothetical protein
MRETAVTECPLARPGSRNGRLCDRRRPRAAIGFSAALMQARANSRSLPASSRYSGLARRNENACSSDMHS